MTGSRTPDSAVNGAHRPGRDAALLAALAEPLQPSRAPWYICGSSSGHPDGWYMVPNGEARARYLGRNVLFAQRAIVGMTRETAA